MSVIFFISSWLSFDWLFLLIETLRRQVISSPADVAKSSIGLLARDVGFEGERLKIFERKRVCMKRRMKVIGFLELLTLGFHKFALRLIFHQVNFDF